jgi:Double zinc ribbon
MQIAIFGIDNDGLNLVANLFVVGLVVVWLALIVWTFFDARRRIEDPVLVACATGASLFPYIGTFVYSILRPPEFLEDAKERQLEIKAAELRVRQLAEMSCPNCHHPIEKNFLRCPHCQRRLKDPCESCGKPVDPRWALCPYCETALPGSRQREQKREPQREQKREPQREQKREPQREPKREPQRKPGKPAKPARAAKQRPAARRSEAAQRSAQRTASTAARKGRASGSGDASPAETPERPRAARRK